MQSDRNICIVGLGLIGGSIALKLRAEMPAVDIIGVDTSPLHCESAIRLNICDKVCSLEQAIQLSAVIIIAIPVNTILDILPSVLDRIRPGTVVMDMGSTKSEICKLVRTHQNRSQYVACHPLAGTENNGPEAAFPSLFQNKRNIICDSHLTSKEAMASALTIMELLGMKNIEMDSTMHDKHIAYVSHLSHISSFMLGKTVLEIEDNKQQIYTLAGTGFESTVRLAKSSPEMWTPIFKQNKKPVQEALGAYIAKLQLFMQLMEEDNWTEINELIQGANAIRPILKGLFQEPAIKVS